MRPGSLRRSGVCIAVYNARRKAELVEQDDGFVSAQSLFRVPVIDEDLSIDAKV